MGLGDLIYSYYCFRDYGFPLPSPEERRTWLVNYKYFDTAEGEDMDKKYFWGLRWATFTGFTFTAGDLLLFNVPKSLAQAAMRLCFHMAPILPASLVYITTAPALMHLRGGKDDCWNHFWAGYAAMIPYAARTRFFNGPYIHRLIHMGFLTALAGALFKRQDVYGVDVFSLGVQARSRGDFHHYKRTFDPWRSERHS